MYNTVLFIYYLLYCIMYWGTLAAADPLGLGVGAEATQTGGVVNYQLKHLLTMTFFAGRARVARMGSRWLPSR